MYIDDTANVTAVELRNKARRISKESDDGETIYG